MLVGRTLHRVLVKVVSALPKFVELYHTLTEGQQLLVSLRILFGCWCNLALRIMEATLAALRLQLIRFG